MSSAVAVETHRHSGEVGVGRVARVTGPDTPYPFAAAVEEYYLPGQARLVGAVRRTLAA